MKHLRRTLFILLFAGVGCGIFQPGPIDPVTGASGPSVWEVGLKEAAETYDESPWKDFGPYGAGIALALAGLAGVKKGRQVLNARKAAAEKPAE